MDPFAGRQKLLMRITTVVVGLLVCGVLYQAGTIIQKNDQTAAVTSSSAPRTFNNEASGYNFGINIDGFAYWSPLGAHCDALTLFGPWQAVNTTSYIDALFAKSPSLLNRTNYPLTDADTTSHMAGYDAGNYKISYEGNATVDVAGASNVFSITNWTTVGTRKEATITLKQTPVSLRIRVSNVDRNNPIRNMKMIPLNEPECVAGNTYRQKFLSKLEPFSTIRFMDWQMTNGSPLISWYDRPLKGSFGRTRSVFGNAHLGIIPEDIVELANITGKDVWVNIPHMADDDYVRQFARFLKTNLNANSKIYLEYSNEVWNSIFLQHSYARAKGRADTRVDQRSDLEIVAEYYGLRLKEVANIFKTEFGTTAFTNRIYPVVNTNIASADWPYMVLRSVERNFRYETGVTPGSYHDIRAIAVNPYIGSDQLASVSGATIFDKMKNVITERLVPWFSNLKNSTIQHGINLPYVAYESGQHLVGREYRQYTNDPGMGEVYKALYTWFHTATNGGLAVHFGLVSQQDGDYHWGLFETMSQTTSPRYQALMDLMNAKVTLPLPQQCTNQCTAQTSMCVANSFKRCGDFNGDGCNEWSVATECSTNSQCQVVNTIASCAPKITICPNTYEPACASNNSTYSNSCELEKSGATLLYKGICQTNRRGDLEILSANYNQSCSILNNQCDGADIDQNGVVDFADLAIMAQNFNRTDCGVTNSWCKWTDIDRNGKVTRTVE